MSKKIFKSINLIRRGSGANLNLFRYTAMVVVLLLGVSDMWASSDYYSRAGVSVESGSGTVYVKKGATSASASSYDKSSTSSTVAYTDKATSSTQDFTTNYAICAVPATDYRFSNWTLSGWSTSPSSTVASTYGVVKGSSTSSSSPTTGTAKANFVKISIDGVSPTSVTLNPTDARTSSGDYTGTVAFSTTNDNAATQIGTPSFGSTTGSGTWTATNSWTAGASTVTYTFKGNGYYGGSGTTSGSRNNSATLTLPTAGGTSSKSVTFTANFPSLVLSAGSTTKVYPATPSMDVTGTATFPVQYCDGAFDFTAAISGASGGSWTAGAISFAVTDAATGTGTVTVPFTFNAGGTPGDYSATLTLTPVANTGGSPKSVILTAYAEPEATNDASVTTTANVTTEYETFAAALAAANATSGATLTLLRNVNLGTITATNNINKAMTIDLNGKELRAAVNANSVGVLTLNANVALTIKDSKTGGKIINEISRNGAIYTINVTKGTLTLESGTIAVRNNRQQSYGTEAAGGVATSVVSMGARAIQQAAATTVNITGGRVESYGTRAVYGIRTEGSKANSTTLNISGGEIYAESPAYVYAVFSNGKLNVSGGTITAKINNGVVNENTSYMEYIRTNNKLWDNRTYGLRGFGYGILLQGGNSVTANANYFGTLNMTGGTVNVINEGDPEMQANSTATSFIQSPLYGVYFNAAALNVKTGTASDGSYSQKYAAKGSITGGTVNVTNNGRQSYGVWVTGNYNSFDNSYAPVELKNCTINVSSYYESYGVYATAVVGTTSDNASPNMGACYAGEVELTGATVTATTTTATTAYALFAHAVVGNVYKNATWTKAKNAGYTQVYDGEFGSAAKITVNSGTYTATSATTTAYAVGSTTRVKTTLSSETSVAANRELGGNAEAYPVLILHGGTFKGETGTTTSGAVLSGGHTTIDGGTYTAYSGTTTSRGIYATAGTLDVSNVEISASGTTTAYGIDLACGISDYTGFKYYADATLKNLTVTATTRTGNEADAVLMEVTKRPLSTTTYNALSSSNKTNYGAIYQYGEYAVGAKCSIIGGSYTAKSAVSTAYGIRMNSAAICEDVNGDGELAIGAAELSIKNATFDVEAKTGSGAYGIWAGGPATVDNSTFTVKTSTSDAFGIRPRYGKTTISNSTINVTAGTATARGVYVDALMSSISTTNNTTHYCGVQGFEITGELESNNNTITATANGGNTAYAIQVIDAKGSATQTTADKGLAFKGDHACAGKATINGGKYTATASGTTAYAVIVSDPTVQGEATATPECIINDGKFYGYAAGGTYADVSINGETGYFVLNGGYYVKDENLDKKLGEGMNKVSVKSGTPEYTEGYRYRVTDNMTGEIVCKVYEGTTVVQSYQSLEEALAYVNLPDNSSKTQTIVMCGNYTLSSGDYELPANKTLLVPYKSSGTGKGATQAVGTSPAWVNYETKYVAPSPLYKLTFAPGVNLTVKNGAIVEASCVVYVTNGSNGSSLLGQGTGIPHDKYGWIYLDEDSHIDLESGATLIAWGFVTGKGEINAKNGSVVYEDFQMGDWRGGSVETSIQGNKNGINSKGVFPITHYYYQNIECPITYRAGSTAYALGGTAVNAFGATNAVTNPAVQFIGTTGAMFLLDPATAGADTWVRKEYDPETDYVNWTLNSGAKIGSITLKMSAMGMNINLNSSDYVLPITSNFNIIANYGDVEITNDVAFLPGSMLTIKKEANVTIPSGKNIFFYDQDDWKSYGGYWFGPGYSPSWKLNPRKQAGITKMPDAAVLVEGALTINGKVYTTAGGANVYSTRENAGKVVFGVSAPASTAAVAEFTSSSGTTSTLCQIIKAPDSTPTYEGKALNSVWLKNEDGFSKTGSDGANTPSGKTWIYMEDDDHVYRWILSYEDGCFTYKNNGGGDKQLIHPSDWVAVQANTNGDHAYHSEDGTRMFINAKAATGSKTCVWWEVDPTPETISGTKYYIANNEYFDNYGTYFYWDNSVSYWKPKKITVTWNNYDGSKLTNGTYGDEYNFNTIPQFYGTNPTRANTDLVKYDWIGWRDSEGNMYEKNATLPIAQGDITYTAYFVETKYQSTITFINPNNTVIWSGLVDKGSVPVCPVEPTQASTVSTDYTFTGWNTTPVAVTGPATYTAVYSETTRQYHVTFYNYDAATVLYEADVDYNTRPVYGGVTPFRANTSAYSYEWTGWQQGATLHGKTDNLAIVTGDVYYVATFSQTDLKYQVFFKRQDGSIIDAPFFNYGETPTDFPANPTLASTVSTNYTFDHWTPATLQPVTVDGMVYTAYFSESPRQYTANFVNYDGTSLGVDQTIDYNTAPTYAGTTPFHPNDNRNSYEFAGWAWESGTNWEAGSIGIGEAFPAIKGDITFTAQYNKTLLQFNVIYKRADGTVIEQQKKKWGESTAFPSVSSYEDDMYVYTFDHWNPATVVTPVTVDATYTAYFNQAVKTYSISGIAATPAGYGSVSPTSVTDIPNGSDVSVNGNKITVNGTTVTATPIAADAQYTYAFDHWNNVPAKVTGNISDIEAVFTRTVNTYTIIWKNGNVTLETDENVEFGATPTYNSAEPTKAATAEWTYTFNGWSPAIESVSGDATYTATFSATKNAYEITWLNDDNSLIDKTTVEYGVVPTHADATKANTAEYTYTFTGWDNTPVAVTGTATYKATFSSSKNSYEITWLNEDNSLIDKTTVEYGVVPTHADATKANTAEYTYTFTGWDNTPVAVTGAATYKATFSATKNSYTVTWKNGDATLETDENVEYGTTPTYEGDDPMKATDATYGYTFDGWSATNGGDLITEIPAVSGNTTYYAHYSAMPTVASVKVSSTTTYYATIDAAFAYVNLQTVNTELKLLQNAIAADSLVYTPAAAITCTLDLNNHTLSGAMTKLMVIKLAGSTFVVTDNSDEKGGVISNNHNANARVYTVFHRAGTLKMQGGKIFAKNPYKYSSGKSCAASGVYIASGATFTMDNGTVESESQYASYAIYMARGTSTVTINNGFIKGYTTASTTAAGIYNLGKGLTVNGGHIVGHAYTTTAYGIYLYGGHGTINGGTIEATNDTTSNKGTTTAYGIYVNYYNGTYKGVLKIPSTSTVNVFAKARTTTAYAIVVGANSTGSTIAGGTFTAKTKTSKTAYCVNSSGTITISGGTFNANAATTNAYGLYSARGTITVNGNPTFNVTSGSTTAYGALAYGTIGKKGTGKYSGTIKINGGTFNVTSTTDAYGALAALASRDLRSCSATNDTVPGLHYMPGILEITDGTFNVKATTTTAYGVHVAKAKSESGDVGTTARIPKGTITGGKFRVESMDDANATAYAMNTATTAARLIVEGGWYNTKRTNDSEIPNMEDKYTAPTKSCNYRVLDLPDSELPYKYKVAEAYLVTFKDGDDNTIQSGYVEKGQTPTYTGATPTKTATAEYTYTFTGWDNTPVAVTGTATYKATFSATKNSYEITWLNDDNSLIDKTTVEYGVVPTHADATKANTAEWTYTFTGWDNTPVAVTGTATYKATFSATKNSYEITWLNEDNSLIDRTMVEYGVVPTHADATKANTAEWTYTFTGWDNTPVAVTGTATYKATFSATKNSYEITWLNDDNSLIDKTMVEYGVVPTHADATKANTAEYTYTFTGWDNTPVAVTGTATYKATFSATKNSYEITWLNDDNSLIDKTTVEYGVVPTHADATKANTAEWTFTFTGWDNTPVAVTGAATYKATFSATKNSYEITWLNDDNSLIDKTTVEYGVVPTHADATKANTAEYTYTFTGWDNTPVAVTGTATYKATFSATKNSYEITWLNDDNSLIDKTTVEYGVVPTHADATKANTAEWTYTFTGWDNTPVAVTGTATYKATFSATKNSYEITWLNEDNSLIDRTMVEYGVVPTHADATKANTAEYTYTFTGWDNTPVAVTGAATYKATFSATKNNCTVTFDMQGRGSAIDAQTIEYGAKVTEPAVPSEEGYTFVGWYKDNVYAHAWNFETDVVEANTTLYAKWSRKKYTITWKDMARTPQTIMTDVVWYGEVPVCNYEKPEDERYTYTMLGWTVEGAESNDPIEIPAATEDATYIALYRAVAKNTSLIIENDETVDMSVEYTTTTVKVDGKLTIQPGVILTTNVLNLEGTPTTSGEIMNQGTVDAAEAYFNYTRPGGFEAGKWYMVAVPWQVEVPAGANGGVSAKRIGGNFVTQRLDATFDLIYYNGERRASQGRSRQNWSYLADDDPSQQIMQPGCAYMIALYADADTIRFKKKDGTNLHTNTLSVHEHEAGRGQDAGWNGIANPATFHTTIDVGAKDYVANMPNYGQVYDTENERYVLYNMESPMVVGQPVFVQVPADKTIDVTAGTNPIVVRRTSEKAHEASLYEIAIAPNHADETDRVILLMDENKKKDAYMVCQDLMKLGESQIVPQMWVNRYDSRLCVNTAIPTDDAVDYPLGIYAPEDGEYDIYIASQPEDGTVIYLTIDGVAVWNLCYRGFTAQLEQGTTTLFGLRIVRKAQQDAMGIEDATILNGDAIRKVLIDNKVYIIRNNTMYSIDGQMVK